LLVRACLSINIAWVLIEVLQQKLESSPHLFQVSCFQFPSTHDAFNLPSFIFSKAFTDFSLYFEQNPLSLPLNIWAPSSSFYKTFYQIPQEHNVVDPD
jgi:hypothetical protein